MDKVDEVLIFAMYRGTCQSNDQSFAVDYFAGFSPDDPSNVARRLVSRATLPSKVLFYLGR